MLNYRKVHSGMYYLRVCALAKLSKPSNACPNQHGIASVMTPEKGDEGPNRDGKKKKTNEKKVGATENSTIK